MLPTLDLSPRPLSPLRRVVWGFVLIVLDLDIGVVDLLPDVLGWLLVVTGLHRLAPVHGAFARARLIALVGTVASLLSVVLRRTEEVVTFDDGVVRTTTQQLVEPLVPGVVESLAEASVIFLICSALIAVVPQEDRPAGVLRVFLPLVTVLGAALAAGAGPLGASDADLVLLVIPLVVLGLALTFWFLVVLWRASRASASPAEPALR